MRVIPEELKENLELFEKYLLEVTSVKFSVIKCVGLGMSNLEIAKELYLTEGTVKKYISEILMETQLKNRTQIALLYFIIHYLFEEDSMN
ncbi:MAG TPA: LuxR C-terminal-related transcriptional regulator [Bacilli bacterium]